MQVILVLLLWLVIGLAPVTLAGPIPALLFVAAAKKKKLSRFYLVWFVIINLLLFVYIVGMHGSAGPAPGDFSICVTPLAMGFTFYVLSTSEKEILESINGDLQQQKYYHIGRFLLPAMQFIVLALSILLWFLEDSGLLGILLRNLR
jgi:hypothetical protein